MARWNPLSSKPAEPKPTKRSKEDKQKSLDRLRAFIDNQQDALNLTVKIPFTPTSNSNAHPATTSRSGSTELRTVSYARIGPADGFPVLGYTGLGSNRASVLLLLDQAYNHNLQLISFDRPGNGLTTNWTTEEQEHQREEGWMVRAVAQMGVALMRELHIDRYAVLGHSCGYSYAVATCLLQPPTTSPLPLYLLTPFISQSNLVSTKPTILQRVTKYCSESVIRGAMSALYYSVGVSEFSMSSVSWMSKDTAWDLISAEMNRVSREGHLGSGWDALWALEKTAPYGIDYDQFAQQHREVRAWHGSKDGMVDHAAVEAFAKQHKWVLHTVEGMQHNFQSGLKRDYAALEELAADMNAAGSATAGETV